MPRWHCRSIPSILHWFPYTLQRRVSLHITLWCCGVVSAWLWIVITVFTVEIFPEVSSMCLELPLGFLANNFWQMLPVFYSSILSLPALPVSYTATTRQLAHCTWVACTQLVILPHLHHVQWWHWLGSTNSRDNYPITLVHPWICLHYFYLIPSRPHSSCSNLQLKWKYKVNKSKAVEQTGKRTQPMQLKEA